ncbi:hypothetical protein B0H10DRAFT_300804 [Mycena sp. CBHHK59/15]|nr:hypothetical protein B0H10DRAFT_300804 [Mycena sp. CBHHK59/15]
MISLVSILKVTCINYCKRPNLLPIHEVETVYVVLEGIPSWLFLTVYRIARQISGQAIPSRQGSHMTSLISHLCFVTDLLARFGKCHRCSSNSALGAAVSKVTNAHKVPPGAHCRPPGIMMAYKSMPSFPFCLRSFADTSPRSSSRSSGQTIAHDPIAWGTMTVRTRLRRCEFGTFTRLYAFGRLVYDGCDASVSGYVGDVHVSPVRRHFPPFF